jgi:hypothetical protein
MFKTNVIKTLLIIPLVALVTTHSVVGDEWTLAETHEYYSASRAYCLRVVPPKRSPATYGKCVGTLYKCVGGRKEKAWVWSRYLINNYAPVNVYVADSGKYVVTMDEWHSMGLLPLVVYGPGGELLNVHHLESLLNLKEDLSSIKVTVGSTWWDENAVVFFTQGDEVLCIRLHWGKLLFVRLSSGSLITPRPKGFRDDWGTMNRYADAELPALALKLLKSKTPRDRETGALVSGQMKLPEAVPLLRDLLTDKESYTVTANRQTTRIYYVRKAAKEALEAMGHSTAGVIVEEPYQ